MKLLFSARCLLLLFIFITKAEPEDDDMGQSEESDGSKAVD